MKDTVNILICGVGGQGILLASNVLVDIALEAGLDVKKSEVHGMSQRGGSVVSHVRFGKKVYSPLIRKEEADFIFSFERMETLRYVDFLRKDGVVVVNDQRINPTYTNLTDAYYPTGIERYFEGRAGSVIILPAITIAQELGNPRAANVVMLGVLSRFLEFPEELWRRSIERNVPKKYVELNLNGFRKGREFDYQLEFLPSDSGEVPPVSLKQEAKPPAELRPPLSLPGTIRSFPGLLEFAKTLPRRTVVVAGAENEAALGAALDARAEGIAEALLVGDEYAIKRKAEELGGKAQELTILHEGDRKNVSARAVAQVRDGKGDILLKGSVDTGTLLRAVLNAESGLRTGRLLSDVFLFEYPDEGGSRFIMITDGGVNLSPDIYQKLEILKNGVDVAHALGIELPRVAVLSASENVNPQLPSSVDAAVLTEMNRRGEIPGCLVEGPLALDLAVSRDAARIKGLRSEVAGRVDILLVPDIETGNAVAKATTYFAHYSLGHVIVGATAPVLIPSRSDRKEAKLFSIALGVLMSAFYGAQGVVSKAAEAAASV